MRSVAGDDIRCELRRVVVLAVVPGDLAARSIPRSQILGPKLHLLVGHNLDAQVPRSPNGMGWRNEVSSFTCVRRARSIGDFVGSLGSRTLPLWTPALDYELDDRSGSRAGCCWGDAMPLTRVIDLIGHNTHLNEFLPPLAASLRSVANFDVLGVVVPHDGWRA